MRPLQWGGMGGGELGTPIHLNDFSLRSEPCLCPTHQTVQEFFIGKEGPEGSAQVSADRTSPNRYQTGCLLPWHRYRK